MTAPPPESFRAAFNAGARWSSAATTRPDAETAVQAAWDAFVEQVDPDPDDSGQWCTLHDCHQDDPDHDYQYPACERALVYLTTRR